MSRGIEAPDVPLALRVERPRPTNGHVVPPPAAPGDGHRGHGGDGSSGRGIAPIVLATIFVIAGEVMLFAGLGFAFWVLRLAAPVWPPPLEPRLPIGVTGANTVVLLLSAVAVIAAVRAGRRGDRDRLVRRLGVTAALGSLFLVVQGYEWLSLVRFGLTVSSGLYGATFYTLIGAHAAHVAVALGWLGAVLVLASRGRLAAGHMAPLHACAAYWTFVTALWPLLYVSVYLA